MAQIGKVEKVNNKNNAEIINIPLTNGIIGSLKERIKNLSIGDEVIFYITGKLTGINLDRWDDKLKYMLSTEINDIDFEILDEEAKKESERLGIDISDYKRIFKKKNNKEEA